MPGNANRRRFGAHMSIAGGLHLAFDAARAARCDCLQIFVKNQRQWSAKPLSAESISLWASAAVQAGISPVVAHATYLINLASRDAVVWRRSVDAVIDELLRCEALGIPYLVLHPGSHCDATLKAGIRRIVQGIDRVHRRTAGLRSILLLETTAGQGTSVGHRFEHLAMIFDGLAQPDRVGVCLDTCHLFAAGYSLGPVGDYQATIEQLDHFVGVDRVRCMHLNDSKKPLGSRVDRHEHIGLGHIGADGFRNVVTDPRFAAIPMILETPKGLDGKGRDWDVLNLRKLRRLARIPQTT